MQTRTLHTIGVVGVRDFKNKLFDNREYVCRVMDMHLRQQGLTFLGIEIVTGGGRGAEQLVIQWCEAKKIPYRKIPPNIQEYGQRRAFAVRNNVVISESDQAIVFWDGRHDIPIECVATAMHLGKQATIYPVK